jgi:hypothetical protein
LTRKRWLGERIEAEKKRNAKKKTAQVRFPERITVQTDHSDPGKEMEKP